MSKNASGTFAMGGDLTVHRLGFGAMRITGDGIWGDPADPAEARRVLKSLGDFDVDFIDTADSYGPFVSEDLIAEVLAPYPRGMVVATKGGLTRHGPDSWLPLGRPEYLRQCVLMSLRRLKVDRIDLWQLHRIDSKVPAKEQFDVMAEMQKEGLIRHLGLSEVSVEQIRAAAKHFKVATVQNLFNIANRQSEAVLEYCEKEGIGFIPWFPLNAGSLAQPGGIVDETARKHRVSPAAVALAWLLKRSKVMLPIPGTGQVRHLAENMAAATLELSDQEYQALDKQGRAQATK